jgi:environmental stress-induced protein Ves
MDRLVRGTRARQNDTGHQIVHLPCEKYRSMPWRNGMGVTSEIAREPSVGGEFLWRLSLATVASSGPFSNYAGFSRSVTLIEGRGFRLDVGNQEPMVLDWPGATALFPGDAASRCSLIDGPSTDLSLMVREPGSIISVIRIQCADRLAVPLESGAMKAVFCLSGGTLVTLPQDVTTRSGKQAGMNLALHDTALLRQHVTTASLSSSPGTLIDLLLLSWKAANTERS